MKIRDKAKQMEGLVQVLHGLDVMGHHGRSGSRKKMRRPVQVVFQCMIVVEMTINMVISVVGMMRYDKTNHQSLESKWKTQS